MVPDIEGGYTKHIPSDEAVSIYDAAMRYQGESTPLVIIAGQEYGTGSSRDWAAKGTRLLGVKAVIAESFERIHRSNLVGMGVLPLQFKEGDTRSSLGISGSEFIDIRHRKDNTDIVPQQEMELVIWDGTSERVVEVISRLDTANEIDYFQSGGILQFVLNNLVRAAS